MFDRPGFLSVEGSDVTKLDLSGTVLATYHFERLIIHDVAITQDQARMVCVGTMTASMDGLHPSKCRAEKQILGKQWREVRGVELTLTPKCSVQHGNGKDREVGHSLKIWQFQVRADMNLVAYRYCTRFVTSP